MTKPFAPIGQLPFDDRNALSVDRVQCSADRLARALPSLQDYESRSKYFLHKSAARVINGLELFAFASSPTYIRFGEMNYRQNGKLFIGIPFSGTAFAESEGQRFQFVSEQRGLLFSESRGVTWTGETRSQLLMKLDLNRLSLTAASMIGVDPAEGLLEIARGRSLDLRTQGVDFSRGFRSICSIIDAYSDQDPALGMLAVDDLFYRQCALLLKPELVVNDRKQASFWGLGRSARIGEICDVIRSRLDRPLSLTEMETISGLSARAIQYAFKARFGCSPMQWQRRERLLKAYKDISGASEDVSLSQLAHACGYLWPSAFSADYRRMFGESPSQTRSGSRRKPSASAHQRNSLTNRSCD